MTKNDIKFVPQSDVSPYDFSLVEQHKNLINENRFSDAANLLKENSFEKGAVASLFNSIAKKIQDIQFYLLNKYVAEPDEYYSPTEPTDEEMGYGKKIYWIKPY